MIKKLLLSSVFLCAVVNFSSSQCDINVSVNPTEIVCGQSATLSAFGSSTGQVILDEDFNTGGFGPGWGSTPGATSFSNPCSPGGVDGTPHAWMDNNTSVPRTLVSASYNLTAATAGVTICFDLLFAEQGDAAPCEGPDEPDEGVYLQYSTNGGATWIDIYYFDPNGGNDPQLTNWNNWCFQIPAGAITANTMFRWHQVADSGADYDHWGIDNVQIFQNDINAEVEWLHDGYSYGVGNSGGPNPNPVSPTSTTTYTAQITTGTGQVCTADITVVVIDPVFDVNVSANPTTICDGECTDITGTAVWVVDAGGIETYENNQTEDVASGFGFGSIGAGVNVNVQGINMSALTSGTITEVCINNFFYFSFGFPSSVTVADFEFSLIAPGGCAEIILIPQGSLQPSTQFGPGMQDVCFEVGGATNLSSVPQPYSGTYVPNQSFDLANGCDPNGVWTLQMEAPSGLTFGAGAFDGWSITFDDPPILAPVDISWSPTTGLSDPNSINTEACPLVSTDYELTVSNGTPGCATHTEIVSITVNPCSGCVPPVLDIDPLVACAPSTVDLANAVNPSSDPATISYHATEVNAQNDVSPIAQTVGTSGSYWIRAEDPVDPTCFDVFEVVVTINPQDDASFTLTDFCAGSPNSATGIATAGGTFTFNPAPGDGATINALTGSITNGVTGTTYTVQYTTSGTCPASSTEAVTVSGLDYSVMIVDENCGTGNGEINLTAIGGNPGFTYSINGGTTTQGSPNFTGLSAGIYAIEITDALGCVATGNESVGNIGGATIDNITPTNESCPGACDGSITVDVSGGTPPYSYQWFDAGGNPIGPNAATIDNLCDGDYSVEVSDASGGGSVILNTNYDFENGPGGGCDCPTGFACANDAGQVFDGVMPVYAPGNQGCVSTANNYTNSLGANSGTGYVYFYAGADNISTGSIAFTGGEQVELCVWYAGPQGAGASGQNTANAHFSFGMNGAQIGPDVLVPTNTGWTQFCFTVTMTAGNHTFQILSGGAAQYAMWFDDFTVTDISGGGGPACPVSSNSTIDPQLPDDPSFTLTDFCAGSPNSASGIVTPGGTFTFNPAPGDGSTINGATGEITNGVTGTTYTVQYTTAGACPTSSTETVTVSGLDYTVSIVNENCGAGDGEINLTAVGGTPGFTYSIDGGTTTQGTPSFTGLTAGNYGIEIIDAFGCAATGNESVANIGGATIDNITPINESCPGACDGSITVDVSGGNPPYTYQWFDAGGNPIGSNAATIDNLCDGYYSVEVSDAAGGSAQLFYDDFESGAAGWTLNVPVGPEGADPNFFEVDDDEGGVAVGGCGIAGNGDATLHITSVFFPNGGAAYDAGGLCGFLFCPETHRQAESPLINTVGQTGLTLNFDFIAGGAPPVDQATVWYNDGFGWTLLSPLFSGTGACAPQGIWTSFSSPLPASCENIPNLQVAIRWDNNDDGVGTDPSVAINNLEIITSAAANCASTEFATLTAPAQADPSFILTDFCAGTANSATGIVTPGGTFDFNPAPGDGATINATTGEISNSVPGTIYSVEYTTGGACPETSIATVEAEDCCNINLDTTSTVAPSCGQADGTINVQAVGGDGNYTYSIDNGPFVASSSFTNLVSGSYEIVVQDGSGVCSDTIDVQLSDLNAPVITAVNGIDPLCNGDLTGEVEVIANGGFGTLDYEIGNPAPISNNGTGVFTGLAAGNYTVTVTDDNGCQTTDAVVITQPAVVTVNANSIDVSCFGMSDGEIEVIGGGGTPGYNYSIDNGTTWNANPVFTGLTAQTYQVVVEDANGCQSVVENIIIGESNALVVNTVVTDASCFNDCDGSITWNVAGGTAPYQYVSNGTNLGSNNAVNLCAGSYNYTITDANGCSSAGVETVQPGVQVVPVVISRIDDGCTDDCDGEIVIGSNTGVSYTLNGISNGTGVFTGLCAGNYNFLITDANGCTANQSVMIGTTAPTYADFLHLPTTLTVYNSTVSFNNNSINANQYEWHVVGQNGYSHTYTTEDAEHTFPSDTGTYQVCLTAINTGGCQDEMCVTIIVEDEIAIYVPNSFTPDDDEFNQTFRAYVNGIDVFDFDFLIFNRWGELIWESHDASVGWDGTYKGKLVQEGTYVWKIVVKDLQLDYRRTYTGHVSILK